MEFGLKWVHMGQYGVILRLDGALWHTIFSGPLLTHKWPKNTKMTNKSKNQKNVCFFIYFSWWANGPFSPGLGSCAGVISLWKSNTFVMTHTCSLVTNFCNLR